MRRSLAPVAALVLACSSGGGGATPPPGSDGLAVEAVVTGLDFPVHVVSPAGDERLFVVERGGTVRVIQDGALLPTPFLAIPSEQLSSGGERGLLSLAFHPDYASNGLVYVNYTDGRGDVTLARYQASPPSANAVDPASETILLRIPHRDHANHNGGLVAFGPDGMLYMSVGDGGGAGDPGGNGQNTGVLLGKLLRLQVGPGYAYQIPAGNPFAGGTGGRGEIWAWGLRNPWRFAFDAGQLYVADVGQNAWEEVNVVPADAAGVNYGWRTMEGAHCYGPSSGCDQSGLTLPVLEYDHGDGCSITGGHVYRGARIPELAGHYVYSDYCSGWLRSFRYAGGRATDRREWNVGSIGSVVSFGEDAAGELYIVAAGGTVYRLVPAPATH